MPPRVFKRHLEDAATAGRCRHGGRLVEVEGDDVFEHGFGVFECVWVLYVVCQFVDVCLCCGYLLGELVLCGVGVFWGPGVAEVVGDDADAGADELYDGALVALLGEVYAFECVFQGGGGVVWVEQDGAV